MEPHLTPAPQIPFSTSTILKSGHEGPIELPPLPFAFDALEPLMSKETVEFHYSKHHAGYVQKTNQLLSDSPLKGMSLEDVIRLSSGPLFNNAAQVFNHTFFWNSLSPLAPEMAPDAKDRHPEGSLQRRIQNSFGSLDLMKEEFTNQALALFGSGWVWLMQRDNGRLSVVSFQNGDTPTAKDGQGLLALDVWEHAYYIDHRNDRKTYIENFWKLVNWDFAQSNLLLD